MTTSRSMRAVEALLSERLAHKMNRNFARADELRDKVSRYRSGRSGPKLAPRTNYSCDAPFAALIKLPCSLSSDFSRRPTATHVRSSSSSSTSRCTTMIASGTSRGMAGRVRREGGGEEGGAS